MKVIFLGVGCFWGGQSYYDQIKGVENTEVGYLNGNKENVTYEDVCAGMGHVEVVRIEYNDAIISNKEIFDSYIRIIEPYSKNRQGGDFGIQYRTGIYSIDENIKKDFMQLLKEWEIENKPTQIEIEDILDYTIAEKFHQKYLEKNPKGYCHINMNDIPKYLKR